MIRVIGDRVLVQLPPKPHVQEDTTGFTYQAGETTGAGLILAKPADVFNVELATRGIVVQVGEKRGQVDLDEARAAVNEYFLELRGDYAANGTPLQWGADLGDEVDRVLMAMQPAPFDVDVGDCVLFPPSVGDEVEVDGYWYVILREAEIIGIVNPLHEVA